jgi:ribonuclease Z
MRLLPLGTSAGAPTKLRNVSSLALVDKGKIFLFDCGEGTQHRLLESGLRPGRIEALFITHLHGDHCYGTPGFLATLSLQNRSEPLHVYGPDGLRDFLEGVIRTTKLNLTYELTITEVAGGTMVERSGYRFDCALLEHSVPSLGFRVTEPPRRGRFHPERASALGVPAGPLFRELQQGRDVTLGERIVRSSEVVDLPPGRRSIVICGDTALSQRTVEFARGAEVLVHEATYASDLQQEATARGHSTARDAAEVARSAKARRLILTHFSSRYESGEVLAREARPIFGNTEAARDLVPIEIW